MPAKDLIYAGRFSARYRTRYLNIEATAPDSRTWLFARLPRYLRNLKYTV